MDVANFEFSSASGIGVFNVKDTTPITKPLTPTNGSIAANSCNDGLVGSYWRALYKQTGGAYTNSNGTQTSVTVALSPIGVGPLTALL
jgi:hypothetical protein